MANKLPITERAYRFAAKAHKGQKDDSGLDFFHAHPLQVYLILGQILEDNQDENLMAAALLHDVIEDTTVIYEELVEEFGSDVADLVNEVTHEGQKDNHGFYFPRLHSKRGVMLKLADRLSNLSRMQAWSKQRQDHYVKKTIAGIPTKGPDED